MRPMTDCRFYTLLFVILIKCTLQAQQQKTFKQQFHQPYAQKKLSLYKPAENLTKKNYGAALIESLQNDYKHRIESRRFEEDGKDDNKSEGQSHKEHEQEKLDRILKYSSSLNRDIEMTCAKNCLRNITRKNLPYATNKTTRTTSEKNKKENSTHTYDSKETTIVNSNNPLKQEFFSPLAASMTSHLNLQPREGQILLSSSSSIFINSRNAFRDFYKPSQTMPSMSERKVQSFKQVSPSINKEHHLSVHVAHKMHHKEVKTTHREAFKKKQMLNRDKESFKQNFFLKRKRFKRDTTKLCKEQTSVEMKNSSERTKPTFSNNNTIAEHDFSHVSFTFAPPLSTTSHYTNYTNSLSQEVSNLLLLEAKSKRSHSVVRVPAEILSKAQESVVIIDDGEEFDSADDRKREFAALNAIGRDERDDHKPEEHPRTMLLRPVLPNPYEDEEMSVVYAEQHSEIRLMCEVDLDIVSTMWYKNGQVVHAMDRTTRVTDYRFIKEANGALTITNVMLEDDGKWQCEAENAQQYLLNARTVKLVVLDRPKPPYLLIDSRRLDAGNIFVPVKENSELNLACISEGGNPRPTLSWEVLLSPGVDRHAQKISVEDMELEEVKNDKDKNAYKINNGAKSEARLRAVYRAHHNARILCVMEHPTLKMRQNASLLLDVQYTPSFAISRTPGFGYPLREGIEVSLKCDVDSNPPSTPRWQKDDGDPPVLQIGDGFLNFTTIRREHSGWYKCTSRHLNFQYSSIGYYLSVRYDSVDVTSEPDDQDMSVAASSHNPNKGQLEVQLGGAVTLQCPQGSLGCWSHLDPITARLKGLGHGSSIPTGQFSLKDVVYQDAGTYKCIGQSPMNKKKLEVLQTVAVSVRGAPTAVPRNATPVAYPGSPLHLSVDFCANPSAHAARWLHGDRVYTPGNQYGSTVLAYAVKDLPTPYCKEARLTYVSMHERVPRTFYFIVSSPGGVAEATFKVNFTMRYRTATNVVDEEEEELSEPEEIHFPVFGSSSISESRCTPLTLLCAITLHVFIPSP